MTLLRRRTRDEKNWKPVAYETVLNVNFYLDGSISVANVPRIFSLALN